MPDTKLKPEDWVCPKPEGLYIAPGGFYIDPVRPVDKAVITHGHGDHARPGHRQMLATAETLAICQSRFPTDGVATQALPYRQPLQIGDVGFLEKIGPAAHDERGTVILPGPHGKAGVDQPAGELVDLALLPLLLGHQLATQLRQRAAACACAQVIRGLNQG